MFNFYVVFQRILTWHELVSSFNWFYEQILILLTVGCVRGVRRLFVIMMNPRQVGLKFKNRRKVT